MSLQPTTVRGTGRTHYMLEDAVELARKGNKVCVLGTCIDHAGTLRDMAKTVANKAGSPWVVDSNMSFRSATDSTVMERKPGQFELNAYDVVVVDHAVYEHEYQAVVEGWAEAARPHPDL